MNGLTDGWADFLESVQKVQAAFAQVLSSDEREALERIRAAAQGVVYRHFAHQPFGQVPWLTDGDISIFESGAILLHLGGRSDALLPTDQRSRSEVMEWIFAALNSVEMASLPWSLFKFSGDTSQTPGRKHLDAFLLARLQHMESALAEREWLSSSFSIADILMADVLRLVDRFDGLAKHPSSRDYVARATAGPSFVKAHTDQMAHLAAAD